MICVRLQKPVCKSAHEIVRSTIPSATACATRLDSARGYECSWLVLKLGGRLGRLRRGRGKERRREEGEGDEGEEPRDVEVEPVRQHDFEADEKRGRESCHLELVLHARDEEHRERAEEEQHLQAGLEMVEVGVAGVLVPVPDREGRRARQLPAEGSVPEHARCVERVRLEEEDPEAERRAEQEAADV